MSDLYVVIIILQGASLSFTFLSQGYLRLVFNQVNRALSLFNRAKLKSLAALRGRVQLFSEAYVLKAMRFSGLSRSIHPLLVFATIVREEE